MELFDGIGPSPNELVSLAFDPALASNPKYEEELKRRLDHNFDTYLETMNMMLNTMDTIGQKLGLDKQTGTVSKCMFLDVNLLTDCRSLGRTPIH